MLQWKKRCMWISPVRYRHRQQVHLEDRDNHWLWSQMMTMTAHPNAATANMKLQFEYGACAKFMFTWAIKDVNKGDSIDIHYTANMGGPHEFITPHEYVKPIVPELIKMLVARILCDYEEKHMRKLIQTSARQMLVHRGLYWSSSNTIQVSSRFTDEFESLFGCKFTLQTHIFGKYLWMWQQNAFPGTPFAFD